MFFNSSPHSHLGGLGKVPGKAAEGLGLQTGGGEDGRYVEDGGSVQGGAGYHRLAGTLHIKEGIPAVGGGVV